jgi:hypothetical protein
MQPQFDRRKFLLLVGQLSLAGCGLSSNLNDQEAVSSNDAIESATIVVASATPRPSATVVPSATPKPTPMPLVSKGKIRFFNALDSVGIFNLGIMKIGNIELGSTVLTLDDGNVLSWDISEYTNLLDYPIDNPKLIKAVCGEGYAVGIDINHKIVGWGVSENGALNIPNIDEKIVDISTCNDTVMALAESGRIYAWGGKYIEVLDIPSELKNVVHVSVGYQYGVAVDANNVVWQWGENDNLINTPKKIEGVVSLSTGIYHAAVATEDGSFFSWGEQSDDCSRKVASSAKFSSLKQVVAWGLSTFILEADGTLTMYGGRFDFLNGIRQNLPFICGDLHYNPSELVKQLGTRIVQITTSTQVLTERGSVISWPDDYKINKNILANNCKYAWGNNAVIIFQKSSGITGIAEIIGGRSLLLSNYLPSRPSYDPAENLSFISEQIVNIYVRTEDIYQKEYVVLMVDGSLKTYAADQQIGESINNIKHIAVQENSILMVDNNNKISSIGTMNYKNTPAVNENIMNIVANAYAAMIVTESGQLYVWGDGAYLQDATTDVSAISSSSSIFSALSNNGELRCWGYFGESTIINKLYINLESPVAVANGNTWVAILLKSGEVTVHYLALPERVRFYIRDVPPIRYIHAYDQELLIITESNDLIIIDLSTRPIRASCVLECIVD